MTLELDPLLLDCSERYPQPWRSTGLPALGFNRRSWTMRRIRDKECFFNAYKLAEHYGAALQYAEGLVVFEDAVVVHAWNVIGETDIDLTWEYHRPELFDLPHHRLVVGTLKDLQRRGYYFAPDQSTMVEQYRRAARELAARGLKDGR